MGQQFRSLRAGEVKLRQAVTRASSTIATIPNYGVTEISTGVGTDFVLDTPEEGVTKVLYNTQATTGVFVRACPVGGTNTSFSSTAADTVLEFDGAGDKIVTLVGLSTSRWLITSIRPVSTALIVGTS